MSAYCPTYYQRHGSSVELAHSLASARVLLLYKMNSLCRIVSRDQSPLGAKRGVWVLGLGISISSASENEFCKVHTYLSMRIQFEDTSLTYSALPHQPLPQCPDSHALKPLLQPPSAYLRNRFDERIRMTPRSSIRRKDNAAIIAGSVLGTLAIVSYPRRRSISRSTKISDSDGEPVPVLQIKGEQLLLEM